MDVNTYVFVFAFSQLCGDGGDAEERYFPSGTSAAEAVCLLAGGARCGVGVAQVFETTILLLRLSRRLQSTRIQYTVGNIRNVSTTFAWACALGQTAPS